MLLIYSIALGLILGRLAGGRAQNLEHVRFAWWGLALAGFGVQLVLFAAPVASRIGAAGPAIYVASTLVVMAVLLRNVRHPGFAILALGATLNLVAVMANGGAMPSSPDAWFALNGVAELPVAHFSNSVLIGPDTLLPFLGDVFVWPRPLPLANVFSIGDAIIAVGAIVFLVTAMRQHAEPQTDPQTEQQPSSSVAPAAHR